MTGRSHIVAVSQRVDIIAERGERRDALDQRWHAFLASCGLFGVPIPNAPERVDDILAAIAPVGIVLSGGNDLAAYGGDSNERDLTESAMMAWARQNRRPVLGVCRGLQMLAHTHGGVLKRVTGHVGARHKIRWNGSDMEVNSYHNWGFDAAPDGFEATARSSDGFIEAMRHTSLPIAGIMWHPEREQVFVAADMALFQEMFGDSR